MTTEAVRPRAARAPRTAGRRRRYAPNDTTRPAVVSQVLLTLVLLLFLVPFAWMVATALKPAAEVFGEPRLVGSSLRFDNFTTAWSYVPFGRFMVNGIVVSVAGTLVTCVTSVLAAYAFARLEFRGREFFFLLYLVTLMVPQEVMVVPMFILMQEFGWTNTYQALVLPWAFSAFGTFLLRQFFRGIPRELEEAALVDGANRLRVLVQVVLPIARPAVAVLAVFTFINYWNSFLWPLIITNSQDMATVPLGLNLFLGQQGSQWHLLMAAATISVVPTVVVVLLLQRHLVRGIAMSGLGGR
ncbi:carbohydrate ABC transporter permease [Kineococcus terrestris]|uniref:carbohydrate ABC transporter permease n=1 Tax=Kineococcus terrestris TaxID=2044856 RepID=UPI0034DACCB6